MATLTQSTTKSSPKGKTIYMRDIPINLFKDRHPSTFIKFVNLINRLDRDGKGCYAKDEWLARKLEVSVRTIERYTAKGRTLNYLSVINNDKRSRLMLGYDSLRKQFKQEQDNAPENSQQNINPTFEKPSMNTHETVGFNPTHASGHNIIENNVKNLNKSEEREKEKEEETDAAQWILCLIFIARNLGLNI